MTSKLSLHPAAAALAEPAAFAAALSSTRSHAAVVAAPILPCISNSAYFNLDDLDRHRRHRSRSLFCAETLRDKTKAGLSPAPSCCPSAGPTANCCRADSVSSQLLPRSARPDRTPPWWRLRSCLAFLVQRFSDLTTLTATDSSRQGLCFALKRCGTKQRLCPLGSMVGRAVSFAIYSVQKSREESEQPCCAGFGRTQRGSNSPRAAPAHISRMQSKFLTM